MREHGLALHLRRAPGPAVGGRRGGLAVSVAGNVGHVGWTAPVADKATAAVPPLATVATVSPGTLGHRTEQRGI